MGRNVAFNLSSEIGEKLILLFKDIPKEAIIETVYNLEKQQFITGVINKKSNKTRVHHYEVTWNYSHSSLYPIDFNMTILSTAIETHKRFKKNRQTDQNSIKQNDSIFEQSTLDILQEFNEDENDGDVIESDDEIDEDDDEMDIYRDYNLHDGKSTVEMYQNIRKSKNPLEGIDMSYCPLTDRGKLTENIKGINWEMNKNIQPPLGLGTRPPTHLKSDFRGNIFKTPLESFLAFLPIKFWIHHVHESNKYIEKLIEGKTKHYYSVLWYKISLQEMMTFYAILMQMTCRPCHGRRYEECWKFTQDWYPLCKKMSLRRFRIIRSSLHWNDNNTSSREKDTLYKVRPMINFLKKSIGEYINIGESVALDETCIGMYHIAAKALIYFNPAKPRGKHHCKLYVVCENNHWAAINFKFEHRSYDHNQSIESYTQIKETNEEKDTIEIESPNDNCKNNKTKCPKQSAVDIANDKNILKTTKLVMELMKPWEGYGIVVNMDNYYSSPEVFVKLRQMQIYARGTFRVNRKYLPQFIRFKKAETEKYNRGSFRFATNEKYNLCCYAWNDKCPVHVISSADGTNVEFAQRKERSVKVDVVCPTAIQKYNEGMQGVDQFNRLLVLYSMSSLKWDKYYKKIAMILMDFALTNAYIHFCMEDSNKDKKFDRCWFMEELQYQMVQMDWSRKVREMNFMNKNDECSYSDSITQKKEHVDLMKELQIGKNSFMVKKPKIEQLQVSKDDSTLFCNPISMRQYKRNNSSNIDSSSDIFRKMNNLSDSERSCQICLYEGRGRKVSTTNFCCFHHIRCCTTAPVDDKYLTQFVFWGKKIAKNQVKDISWLCPQENLTCWEKAHIFYVPKGLFKLIDIEDKDTKKYNDINFQRVSKINLNSELAISKRIALLNLHYSKDPSQVAMNRKKTRSSTVSTNISEIGSPRNTLTIGSVSTVTQSSFYNKNQDKTSPTNDVLEIVQSNGIVKM